MAIEESRSRRLARWFGVVLLGGVLLASTGCANNEIRLPGGGGPAPTPTQDQTEAGERLVVPLQVAEGPQGQVLAFVPVFINDQGPFPFALDTGASRTLVDRNLVEQLGLEVTGSAGQVSGVAAKTEAQRIRLSQWRIGDIKLKEIEAVTLDLPGPQQPEGRQGQQIGLAGLLGSDVLSNFGVVTINYDQEQLVLSPRGQTTGQVDGHGFSAVVTGSELARAW